jgi:hypothetical protein
MDIAPRRLERTDQPGVGPEVVAGENEHAPPAHGGERRKIESFQIAQQLRTDQEPSDLKTRNGWRGRRGTVGVLPTLHAREGAELPKQSAPISSSSPENQVPYGRAASSRKRGEYPSQMNAQDRDLLDAGDLAQFFDRGAYRENPLLE